MTKKQTAVVAAIRAGASIDEAAGKAGVNVHTLRRWLSTGRKNPEGPYGAVAALVDRLKDAPRGPKEYARAFILAYGTFVRDASDENGNRMLAALRAIPDGDKSLVISDLADHFLVSVMLQMKHLVKSDVEQACEEMFQEVDALHEILECKYGDAA